MAKRREREVGNKKGVFVDEHDVDCQMDIAVGRKDVMGYRCDVALHMCRCLICSFSFEGTKIGTKDSISHLDMMFVDGAVAHVSNGDIHEFATARTHNNVLHTSRENSMFVLSLSKFLCVASHGRNHGPKSIERLMIL